MHDFDIDFCDERRYEAIDYVKRKYGEENFAQIINFGTFADKQALRDAFKANGIEYDEKNVPDKVLRDAKLLEGRPRNISQHASGVVIVSGDGGLISKIPLYMNGDGKVTQFDMKAVEKLGLLKIDFLGLRFLTVIDNAEKNASVDKSVYGDFDDKATYDMLSEGYSCGLFQLESDGMKKLLKRARPRSLSDITALISLFRPGPGKSIETYLRNRSRPESANYLNDTMKTILSETCGCIVYQEQVMEICRAVAGFTYGHADAVRYAMAKKIKSKMETERVSFIEGAVKNGLGKAQAENLFDEISGFAEYAFNKSHAAAYAVLAYKTAFLKCRYPKEYMAALLTSVCYSNDKKYEYSKECARMGISILPPDVNKSRSAFSAEKDGVRFGLRGIKNVGESAADEIYEEREKNGNYSDMRDLISRVSIKVSRNALTALAQSGALSCFGQNRRTLVKTIEDRFYDMYGVRGVGQLSLFESDEEPPSIEEYGKYDIRELEISLLGIYTEEFLQKFNFAEKKTLYIRVNESNDNKIDAAVFVLMRKKGGVSLVLYYEKNGKTFRSSEGCFVDDSVLSYLRRELGNDNCVIK